MRHASQPRRASLGDAQASAIPSQRLRAIDAARGAAMVLVCLSHFAASYIGPAGGNAPGSWLRFIAHIASPMFFIISGAMVGYLSVTRADAFARTRTALARRALFFLTVGHLLIIGAHLRGLADIAHPPRMLFVTDTIALALLLSPWLVRLRGSVRLIGSLCAYVAGCALVYAWDPVGPVSRIFKDTIIGPDGEGFWSYNVPVVPWLAIHAAGTVLGGLLAGAESGPRRLRLERTLIVAGVALVATAAAVRAASWYLSVHVFAHGSEAARIVRELGSPWYRQPPSPAHILMFGGAALLVTAAVFIADRLRLFSAVTGWLEGLGRASAFVFVLQFYVYYVVISRLLPLRLELAPIVFIGSLAAIGVVAKLWRHRHRAHVSRSQPSAPEISARSA